MVADPALLLIATLVSGLGDLAKPCGLLVGYAWVPRMGASTR